MRAPLAAEQGLYHALLEKNLAVPYTRSKKNEPDPTRAHRWLGRKLAARYLEKAGSFRWPQEGLNVSDMSNVWR